MNGRTDVQRMLNSADVDTGGERTYDRRNWVINTPTESGLADPKTAETWPRGDLESRAHGGQSPELDLFPRGHGGNPNGVQRTRLGCRCTRTLCPGPLGSAGPP